MAQVVDPTSLAHSKTITDAYKIAVGEFQILFDEVETKNLPWNYGINKKLMKAALERHMNFQSIWGLPIQQLEKMVETEAAAKQRVFQLYYLLRYHCRLGKSR